MPENDSIITGLDGVTFVSYLAQLSGIPVNKAKKRAHDVLFFVGLEEERYRKTEQYSAGMKQKLKLAQAIVHSPELLLLDEPTSGMDPQGRKDLIKLIKTISKEENITIIYSSHLLADIEEACEKVIIMNKGKILTVDSVANLKKRDYNSYELKLKNNIEKFLIKIKEIGIDYDLNNRKIYTLIAPKDFPIKKLFNIAYKEGTQIRYFKNKRTTLEQKFLKLIGEANGN
jgi:ABC-2 type transport system ATP-binding protein